MNGAQKKIFSNELLHLILDANLIELSDMYAAGTALFLGMSLEEIL